jgi:methyltransferase family protein
MSDFIAYQSGFREHERIRKLVDLVPKGGKSLLDAGARDGSLSILLADHFEAITALDQNKPSVSHAKVVSVQGDITSLEFSDRSFDCVMCAEVLEHVPPELLVRACSELQRVAAQYLVIGVPYKQDLRVSRTTCYTCGKKNPPWGHVNVFDEDRLRDLFPGMDAQEIMYVGRTTAATNVVSTLLMDIAGNPYGTYSQEECCVHCGAQLQSPPARNFFQKVCTKIAAVLNQIQERLRRPQPNWVHVLFRKREHPAQTLGGNSSSSGQGTVSGATAWSKRGA